MDFIKPLCEMSSRTAGLIFLVSIASVLPAPADAQTTTRVSIATGGGQGDLVASFPRSPPMGDIWRSGLLPQP